MDHAPAASNSTPSAPAPTSEEERPLPIAGFQGTPEEIERQWLKQVYRGDSMKQLTWRAVLMGSVLGGVLSLTNLYVGLKSGWGFGVAITACILSYAIWNSLRAACAGFGWHFSGMTILENNCMQSTASSAGYSTGTTLVSAFSAYVLINGTPLPVGLTMIWVFFLAVLGVTMAIPMKRQMINVEQLRFPTGVATAETLRALYSKGERGMRAAKALGIAGILAAMSTFWMDGLTLISKALQPYALSTWVTKLNEAVLGKAWMGRTVMLNWDPIFIAAGAIIGPRVCVSMLISGTLCWAVYVPILQHQGIIEGSGFRAVVQWTLWAGTACMVTSGLLNFLLQWKSSLRAFRSLGRMFRRGPAGQEDPLDALEAPTSWYLLGQVVALTGLAWLAHSTFGMPYWLSIFAFGMSFVLALVACRVTGETDTTPIGAMGQITQLAVGTISPGDMNRTLMSANMVSSAAISSADLLTDIKSGYLLGANPRKQFIAQFCGIFSGTLVTVLAFSVMVPDASVLGTDQFPAPAAQNWRAVATAMNQGLDALGPIKKGSILIGGAVGLVLALLPLLFPKKSKYFPSAAGVGLAWTFHWYYGMLFCVGGVLAWLLEKASPKKAEEYTFPVASGVIAGGSLMGVALVFWENGPAMIQKLFGH